MASSNSNTSRLPLSKLQLAEQQRRSEEVAALKESGLRADQEENPDSKSTWPVSRDRRNTEGNPTNSPDRGRRRASSLPTKMPPPHLRSRSQSPEKRNPSSQFNTFEDDTSPAINHQPPTPTSPVNTKPEIASTSIGSPDTLAAQRTVARGRVSVVDRILAELNYPRAVVKVVAEYNPTTREQLLCELKKEEARTKWQLTPPNRRRPVESLKLLLRKIERDFGMEESLDEEREIVVDDIELLAKGRKLRKRIDEVNAHWRMGLASPSGTDDASVKKDEKGKGREKVTFGTR